MIFVGEESNFAKGSKTLLRKMVPIGEILELLDNLILSTMDNTVKISKKFLIDIHSCLQDVHENIYFV